MWDYLDDNPIKAGVTLGAASFLVTSCVLLHMGWYL